MLNLFLRHLASGEAWFSCGTIFVLIAAAGAFGLFAQRPRLGRWLQIVLFLCMTLAAVSATPVPIWLAVPLVSAAVGYLLFGFASPRRRRCIVLASCASTLVLASLALELTYYLAQPAFATSPRKLCIIGDSLTAGMGGERTTWPRILAKETGIDVRDLSFAGAITRTASHKLTMSLALSDDADAWILINIGGNDMLGSTYSEDFGQDLDELLSRARGDPSRPRTVLMQELPLIPGAWAFGAHQRRLASKHGVILIPKRVLARVVLAESNVLDGLHLSPEGHERMAREMIHWVGAHPSD